MTEFKRTQDSKKSLNVGMTSERQVQWVLNKCELLSSNVSYRDWKVSDGTKQWSIELYSLPLNISISIYFDDEIIPNKKWKLRKRCHKEQHTMNLYFSDPRELMKKVYSLISDRINVEINHISYKLEELEKLKSKWSRKINKSKKNEQ